MQVFILSSKCVMNGVIDYAIVMASYVSRAKALTDVAARAARQAKFWPKMTEETKDRGEVYSVILKAHNETETEIHYEITSLFM